MLSPEVWLLGIQEWTEFVETTKGTVEIHTPQNITLLNKFCEHPMISLQ